RGSPEEGSDLFSQFALSASNPTAPTSFTVPQNTLSTNSLYYVELVFGQMTDLNTTALPATLGGYAIFQNRTGFFINTGPAASAAATHFAVSAPSPVNAGSPFSFTVTAQDASNNIVPGYNGMVQITSSDGGALL